MAAIMIINNKMLLRYVNYRTLIKNYSSAPKLRSVTAPKLRSVSEILKTKYVGEVKVQGWIEAVRKMKTHIFVDLYDGSSETRRLQLAVRRDAAPPTPLTYGASIRARGAVTINPTNGQSEVAVDEIEVVGVCKQEDGFPLAARMPYNSNHLRQHLHLRLRAPAIRSLLKVRHRASQQLSEILDGLGFVRVETPVLTSNDCEGAGEVFLVRPHSDQLIKQMAAIANQDGGAHGNADHVFFGQNTHLTVSGQLHLEAAARSLNKVYSFGPIFRAENSKSRLHLSEFYMLEAEMAFVDGIENVTKIIERIMKRLIRGLLDRCGEEIALYRKLTDRKEADWQDQLDRTVSEAFAVITHEEACAILNRNRKSLRTPVMAEEASGGGGFSKEQELFLVKQNGGMPLFVVEWPAELKPFYVRPCAGDKVEAVDLLCGGVGEVCGGSVREDDLCRLQNKLEAAGLAGDGGDGGALSWYVDLRRFGNVTTGGFGAGFERILALVLGTTNIKDTIPFPRWPHNCKL